MARRKREGRVLGASTSAHPRDRPFVSGSQGFRAQVTLVVATSFKRGDVTVQRASPTHLGVR